MIYNGGMVLGMTWSEEREFISKTNRHKLLQHRSKHYHYLVDRIAMVCSELEELIDVIKINSKEHAVKTLKGRLIGFLLIRYLAYFLNPQQYSYRGDLIFHASYFLIQQHLFAVVGKLKHLGHIPKDRYFKFRIKTDDLYKLSVLFYDVLEDVIQKKILPHYLRLNQHK